MSVRRESRGGGARGKAHAQTEPGGGPSLAQLAFLGKAASASDERAVAAVWPAAALDSASVLHYPESFWGGTPLLPGSLAQALHEHPLHLCAHCAAPLVLVAQLCASLPGKQCAYRTLLVLVCNRLTCEGRTQRWVWGGRANPSASLLCSYLLF
jgi:hypothetical protein